MNNELATMQAALSAALDAIKDPETGRGLVQSGRLTGLAIDSKGRVRFAIEAPADKVRQFESVRAAAEATAQRHNGVTQVTAVLTAHGDKPPAGTTRVRKGEAPPPTPPAERRAEGLPGVETIIAVASAKGGVGKSTVAVNLACALAAHGWRTGILDLDVYGPSVPTLLGLQNAKPAYGPGGKLAPLAAFGLKSMSIGYIVDVDAPLVWRGPMATSAVRQMLDDVAWAPLDVLVLDLPPGTGDIQLTLAQRIPLNGAIIVSTPQDLALADVRRGIAMFERTHVPILGVIENMAWLDLPNGERLAVFGDGGARRTAESHGLPFLGALPIDVALRQSADAGAPLVATDPNALLSKTFLGIADAVMTAVHRGARATPVIRFES